MENITPTTDVDPDGKEGLRYFAPNDPQNPINRIRAEMKGKNFARVTAKIEMVKRNSNRMEADEHVRQPAACALLPVPPPPPDAA